MYIVSAEPVLFETTSGLDNSSLENHKIKLKIVEHIMREERQGRYISEGITGERLRFMQQHAAESTPQELKKRNAAFLKQVTEFLDCMVYMAAEEMTLVKRLRQEDVHFDIEDIQIDNPPDFYNKKFLEFVKQMPDELYERGLGPDELISYFAAHITLKLYSEELDRLGIWPTNDMPPGQFTWEALDAIRYGLLKEKLAARQTAGTIYSVWDHQKITAVTGNNPANNHIRILNLDDRIEILGNASATLKKRLKQEKWKEYTSRPVRVTLT
jgi:hypothetical protein